MSAAPVQVPAASGRILELDALRGIAALGVVVWHYGAHFGAMPFHALLYPFYNAGFLFVDFFFVLSGYVISRAYWREPRRLHFGRNVMSRIARLYPLHLATLLIVAGLLAALPAGTPAPAFELANNDAKHFLLNLLMLNQSGLQSGWSFNTPAWSISAEFIVNVLFLGFLALGVRARAAAIAIAVVALAGLVATAGRPIVAGQFAFGILDVNLLRCFLGFGLGIAIYLLVHRWNFARVLAARPALSSCFAFASLASLAALLVASNRHPPIAHYLAAIAVSGACVLFVPFSALARTVLRHRGLVFLGDISYSTYLVHYPLQLALLLASALGLPRLDYASPFVFLAFVLGVVAISAATHRYVELPSQRWLLERSTRRDYAPLS